MEPLKQFSACPPIRKTYPCIPDSVIEENISNSQHSSVELDMDYLHIKYYLLLFGAVYSDVAFSFIIYYLTSRKVIP